MPHWDWALDPGPTWYTQQQHMGLFWITKFRVISTRKFLRNAIQIFLSYFFLVWILLSVTKFRLIENKMADAVILKYYMVTVFWFLVLLPETHFMKTWKYILYFPNSPWLCRQVESSNNNVATGREPRLDWGPTTGTHHAVPAGQGPGWCRWPRTTRNSFNVINRNWHRLIVKPFNIISEINPSKLTMLHNTTEKS